MVNALPTARASLPVVNAHGSHSDNRSVARPPKFAAKSGPADQRHQADTRNFEQELVSCLTAADSELMPNVEPMGETQPEPNPAPADRDIADEEKLVAADQMPLEFVLAKLLNPPVPVQLPQSTPQFDAAAPEEDRPSTGPNRNYNSEPHPALTKNDRIMPPVDHEVPTDATSKIPQDHASQSDSRAFAQTSVDVIATKSESKTADNPAATQADPKQYPAAVLFPAAPVVDGNMLVPPDVLPAAEQIMEQILAPVQLLQDAAEPARSAIKTLKFALKPEILGVVHVTLKLSAGKMEITIEPQKPDTEAMLKADTLLVDRIVKTVTASNDVSAVTVNIGNSRSESNAEGASTPASGEGSRQQPQQQSGGRQTLSRNDEASTYGQRNLETAQHISVLPVSVLQPRVV
jgi:hypothetical protein